MKFHFDYSDTGLTFEDLTKHFRYYRPGVDWEKLSEQEYLWFDMERYFYYRLKSQDSRNRWANEYDKMVRERRIDGVLTDESIPKCQRIIMFLLYHFLGDRAHLNEYASSSPNQ
jgi:hypothetical protein